MEQRHRIHLGLHLPLAAPQEPRTPLDDTLCETVGGTD